MKISKWEFEKELDSLISAAKYASSKDTARDYLKKASNKILGYSNIPSEMQREYRNKIEAAKRELGL